MMQIFKPQSIENNKKFYKKLFQRGSDKYIWGKCKRFSPEKAVGSKSIGKYFRPKLMEHVNPNDRVLDIGCGSGVFLPIVAQMCREIIGIDISCDMVKQCALVAEKFEIENSTLITASTEDIPFDSDTFDLVYMVDVIHHVEQPKKAIQEVYRVLRSGGKCIVFEPNKFNVLLALLCFFDRNEWGALRLGSKHQYKNLIAGRFQIQEMEYNGMLIGPDGKLNRLIADFLDLPVIKVLLGWQNPKIYICLKK